MSAASAASPLSEKLTSADAVIAGVKATPAADDVAAAADAAAVILYSYHCECITGCPYEGRKLVSGDVICACCCRTVDEYNSLNLDNPKCKPKDGDSEDTLKKDHTVEYFEKGPSNRAHFCPDCIKRSYEMCNDDRNLEHPFTMHQNSKKIPKKLQYYVPTEFGGPGKQLWVKSESMGGCSFFKGSFKLDSICKRGDTIMVQYYNDRLRRRVSFDDLIKWQDEVESDEAKK
jgi:hypothetical protein